MKTPMTLHGPTAGTHRQESVHVSGYIVSDNYSVTIARLSTDNHYSVLVHDHNHYSELIHDHNNCCVVVHEHSNYCEVVQEHNHYSEVVIEHTGGHNNSWNMALNYFRLHTKKTRDRFDDVIQGTHLML